MCRTFLYGSMCTVEKRKNVFILWLHLRDVTKPEQLNEQQY